MNSRRKNLMGYNEIIVVGIKQILVLRGKIGMVSQH
jgi:hypothetical protein